MRKSYFTSLELLIVVGLMITLTTGYVWNIIRFAQSDFESPWKSEIVHGVGIVVPPVGVVCGFIDCGK